MRLANYIQHIKRYFVGNDDQDNLQTMPEVNRAMIEDSPRVVRITLWTIGAFFL
ncbi:HlyD family type I secretion periplasmic adaptor subunit, partial [Escherichia coli]